MGSSVVGAGAGEAYSYWQQTAVKGGQVFSTHITGGDPNYGTRGQPSAELNQNAYLWAKRVVLQADPAGGSIRYRYDGGAPSGSSGHILTGGDSAAIENFNNIRNFQFASTQVTAGTLLITAER